MMAVMMTPRKLPSYFATEEEHRPAVSAAAQKGPAPEPRDKVTPANPSGSLAASVRRFRAL